MKKYSKKLIWDYINGEEIENTEELENDKDFMKDVIIFSKDVKMYRLCSDDLKGNYSFVLSLIDNFKNNLDFIIEITNNFLEKNSDDILELEIYVIVSEIIKNSNKAYNYMEFLIVATTKLRGLYDIKRAIFELSKKEYPEYENLIEMGFWYLFDEYNKSSIVMDYLAKQYISEIFNEVDLEKYVHRSVRKKEILEKTGITNYLIKLIATFDSDLSEYLMVNQNILEDLVKELRLILANWDIYEENYMREKYEIILEESEKYFQEKFSGAFCETELLYFIAREFGIAEQLKKYDLTFSIGEDFGINVEDSYLGIDKSRFNFSEMQYYLELKKIFTQVLNPDFDGYYENNPKTKNVMSKDKIIKFPMKK